MYGGPIDNPSMPGPFFHPVGLPPIRPFPKEPDLSGPGNKKNGTQPQPGPKVDRNKQK